MSTDLRDPLAPSPPEVMRALSLLEAALEAVPDALLVVDTDGRITRANGAFTRLWGLPHALVASHDDTRIFAAVLDQLEQPLAFLAKVAELYERPHADSRDVLGCKDGRTVERCSRPQRIGEVVVGRVWSFRDITDHVREEATLRASEQGAVDRLRRMEAELRRSEAALRQTEDKLRSVEAELRAALASTSAAQARKLEAANQELESFCYSVSHDLRAPLRSIDGFSQAVLEEYAAQLDETAQGYLRRVRAASKRMAHIIDDLLNLSRVSRLELRTRTADLSAIARSVADELVHSAPHRDVTFVIEDGVIARGDPELLRIVLENLMGNAWKFSSKQPRARIEFGCTPVDGVPAYFVRDDGAGFDMAYADKLFGAFQRLHAADEYEGNGIGLATVSRIVQRHGGRVWAEAVLGDGATFLFTLEGSPTTASPPPDVG